MTEVAIPVSDEVVVPEMDADQANDITKRIRESLQVWQQAGEEVYRLLTEAHDGKAWKALNYANWDEYIASEFDKARTWGYDMLTRGFVMKAIGQTLDELDITDAMPDKITFREAQAVKGNLDGVTTEIRDRIAEDPENAAKIVKEAVQKAEKARKPRQQKAQPLEEAQVEVQGGEIVDAEIVDEGVQDAIGRLMSILDHLNADNFPDPADLAPHLDTIQWEKINRTRIWLLRFNMVMP